ncbi:hypothetical protein [Ancylobacter oerskovii]|uniref:Uncharacterized protein n=1 Tax=Ancylobacter oerskovii TaxID=459519 RepID=A0ABW4Z1J0_9HYPH|nr:hypothetical protein [Ancylobacter oerskovii]MBS7545085.1 hypothetical protein [Ancylobacter oerskovii]
MSFEAINSAMWASAVQAAAGNAEAIAAFKADTGMDLRANLPAVLWEFVRWFTVNHWGLEFAPQSYRDSLNTKPAEREATP